MSLFLQVSSWGMSGTDTLTRSRTGAATAITRAWKWASSGGTLAATPGSGPTRWASSRLLLWDLFSQASALGTCATFTRLKKSHRCVFCDHACAENSESRRNVRTHTGYLIRLPWKSNQDDLERSVKRRLELNHWRRVRAKTQYIQSGFPVHSLRISWAQIRHFDVLRQAILS